MLLIDLGGGSCEITLSEHKRLKETISLPLGAVRLTEEFLPVDPAPPEDLARMRRLIARELRRAHRRIRRAACNWSSPRRARPRLWQRLCAALAKTARLTKAAEDGHAAQRRRERLRRHASSRPRSWLQSCSSRMTLPEREAVPGIGPRRAEIIVGRARSLCGAAGELRSAGFRYSPLGLRDGILAQMLAAQDDRAPRHRQFEIGALGDRSGDSEALWRGYAAG